MARRKIKRNKRAVKNNRNSNLSVSDIVSNIFTNLNNLAAYSSIDNVFKEVRKVNKKISRTQVMNELYKNRTYTIHKPIRKIFKRLVTIPDGFMSDLQADLADFQQVASQNDGFRYLLVCVDVLSRRIFTAPVKSKGSKDMMDAFDRVFETMPNEMIPLRIFTDKGVEFEAKEMKEYFKKKEILKYVTQSPDVKAAMAERAIRTIKTRLFRYFTQNESYRWIEPVEKIVTSINKSVNRTTGMRPIDVNIENAVQLWNKLYLNKYNTRKKYKYQEGEPVRISKEKGTFEKGYLPNYSQEVFKIDQVKRGNIPNYRLVDSKGEEIYGKFYEPEFSRAKADPNKYYVIEKVLDERKRAGKPEFLVKWVGLPENKATWIRRNDID